MKKSWLYSLAIAAAAMLIDYQTRGTGWMLLVYVLWVPVFVIGHRYLDGWASKRKDRQRWVPFLAVAGVLSVGVLFQVVIAVGALAVSP
ncbi:TPA: hypothetical protein ACG5BG_004738 [Pseudomonas aeruginosa]|uniref:hypothetical protein n=1 Tax=Pseudomonas aeruginosa TaxID=287 RepID=UPI00053E404F|nr:hypothetical protein [Pseudomonas aeruginosa]EMC2522650.1 hypothetical protein [Pseudomonas aeruginosa]MBA5207868.1 hypothetical protein [Pseudomonas aeruginosa]MBG4574123.1 hypothetical protein [Pseudomonas aeruginosa]MBM9966617.1 hypothetical protein [Pseudomonas aeruginosa]MBN0096805.1 hypothetical protein [Pseudomonas aeruginosa]